MREVSELLKRTQTEVDEYKERLAESRRDSEADRARFEAIHGTDTGRGLKGRELLKRTQTGREECRERL